MFLGGSKYVFSERVSGGCLKNRFPGGENRCFHWGFKEMLYAHKSVRGGGCITGVAKVVAGGFSGAPTTRPGTSGGVYGKYPHLNPHLRVSCAAKTHKIPA